MRATIGRTVHYQGPGNALPEGPGAFPPTTYPAIITEAFEDGSANLFVMTQVGHMNLKGIPFSETPTPGSWNWPSREQPSPSATSTEPQAG